MLTVLHFFHYVCLLYAAPAQEVFPSLVPAEEIMTQDSISLLANEWVLRERLHKEQGKFQPMQPFEKIRVVLYPDQTYKLVREHDGLNVLKNTETTEWGNWEINKDRGLISVQVTNVDGRSILSSMLYR